MLNKVSMIALIGALLVYEPLKMDDERPVGLSSFDKATSANCVVGGMLFVQNGTIVHKGALPCAMSTDGELLPGAAP